MRTQNVIFNLRDRRARIAGEIAMLKRTIRARNRELYIVDNMLALIDAGNDPKTIKHIRPFQRLPGMKHGEMTKMTYEILKAHPGELTAAQIGRMIAERKGVEADRDFQGSVQTNLGRLRAKGIVQSTKAWRGVKWALAEVPTC